MQAQATFKMLLVHQPNLLDLLILPNDHLPSLLQIQPNETGAAIVHNG